MSGLHVIIAGMKRSGSTWQYNAARLAMIEAGLEPECFGDPDEYNSFVVQHPERAALLKWHWWAKVPANRILVTTRNVEDVYASLTRFNGKPPTGANMAKIVEHARRWEAVADLTITYDQIIQKPVEAIREILWKLDVRWTAVETIAEQVAALEPPAEGQDPDTLLFHNHRA